MQSVMTDTAGGALIISVGDAIRKLRKAKRPIWSLRALAKESGIGRMTISAIERNESNYQRETLDRIAKALGKKNGAELEAMVVTATTSPSLPRDQDVPVEYVALARRISRLDRHAQGCIINIVLAFEGRMSGRNGQPE